MARTQSPDTGADAERVQLDLLRRMGEARRAALGRSMSRAVIAMARAAIRRQHPELDEEGVRLRFIELVYGPALAARVREARERARR